MATIRRILSTRGNNKQKKKRVSMTEGDRKKHVLALSIYILSSLAQMGVR
jgi:hypothetical protein